MIAPYCERHGRRVLLSESDIVSVINASDGIVVSWQCFCGHRGRTAYKHHAGATVPGDARRQLA